MTAVSFVLRSLDTGAVLGDAVVCVAARYCSVQWRGADWLDRRFAPAAAWKAIESELEAGFEAGPLPAASRLAATLVGDRATSVTVQQLVSLPMVVQPGEVTAALDALLRATVPPLMALRHVCADGWVCEEHPNRGFPHDDCGGPGAPCPVCNADGARRPTWDELWASTDDHPKGGTR